MKGRRRDAALGFWARALLMFARVRKWRVAAVVVGVLMLLAGRVHAEVADLVDLRPYQSPIQTQGHRNTCCSFASVAALEAAYRRAGFPDLKLSEQFANHLAQTLSLIPGQGGPDRRETRVAATGGGSHLWFLRGLRVVEERYLSYRREPFPESRLNWSRRGQFETSSFNLDPRHLPREALTAPRYFSVKSFRLLRDPRDPVEVEEVLRQGHEVIWGEHAPARRLPGVIWEGEGPPLKRKGHYMLIVGYDRTGPVPCFIVKNSGGPTRVPGAQGYTYVSYRFYRTYSVEAGYITAVNSPRSWPELAALGRREVTLGGRRGMLDIYHLPGTAHYFGDRRAPDTRLGTFYEGGDPRKARRVNGKVRDGQVILHLSGRRFTLDLECH
jgi:hypothetical protein